MAVQKRRTKRPALWVSRTSVASSSCWPLDSSSLFLWQSESFSISPNKTHSWKRGPSAVPWWMSYGFLSSASDDSNTNRNRPSWSKQMKLSTCIPSMTEDYQAKRPWPETDTSLLFLELGGEKIMGEKFGWGRSQFSIWGGEACHFKQLVTENNN